MNRTTIKAETGTDEAGLSAAAIEARAVTIAMENDKFRTTFGADFTIPGRIVWTAGVNAKGEAFTTAAMVQTMTFDTFTEDNDPNGEHNFGSFEIGGDVVFWKIDYFADGSCTWGSEDPADIEQTFRVLTILLASEY